MVDPTDNSKINHKFVWSKLTIIKIYGSDGKYNYAYNIILNYINNIN